MKMQLLRWNNPGHDTRRASSMVRGAGCRELNPRLRRREKNVLDIPLYRSALALNDRGRGGADPVNEFYKKGCQEKNSASTGGRDFSLEIQPTVVFATLEKHRWWSISGRGFSAVGGQVIEFERAASRTGAQGQPWFYRRLVAYGYFWFSEGA